MCRVQLASPREPTFHRPLSVLALLARALHHRRIRARFPSDKLYHSVIALSHVSSAEVYQRFLEVHTTLSHSGSIATSETYHSYMHFAKECLSKTSREMR
jgi:hypothetical protein